MQYLDLTLPTAAENIALDDALQQLAENLAASGEPVPTVLRVWEAQEPVVVIGRASRWAEEVDREACEQLGIPILRRSSGGAAVVGGPGCLMYAVVVSYDEHPAIRVLDEAHRLVLGRFAEALEPLVPGVARQGISDLVWRDRKVSGNSLRCRRHTVLYHGTLLYDFPLELISRCLKTAPRQPAYRRGREHGEFVANLPVAPHDVRARLQTVWNTTTTCDWPRDLVKEIVAERYSQDTWNFRL